MANLKDLIEDGVLKYDGYKGEVFDNLTVVGWNGLYQNNKKYIVTCSVCILDTELHGEGYFSISKGHLLKGVNPCGCSDKCKWTEDQYSIRVERACDKAGLVFVGWGNEFTTANKTLVEAHCIEHGKIGNASISFVVGDRFVKSCPQCFAIRMGNSKRKEYQDMVDLFMSTGLYPEGTVFTRSDREDKNGHKKYWFMDCPDCQTRGEGHIVGIYKGSRSCACSNQRQLETYINLIKDNQSIVVIKFGVANNSITRAKDQNSKSIYSVEPYGVWTYPDIKSCKSAERTCKHSMEVGVISKQEMNDGYTETTYPTNIDLIISIFEEYGGIRNI